MKDYREISSLEQIMGSRQVSNFQICSDESYENHPHGYNNK